MNEHQLAAYAALSITAEQLRALISSARSSLHPLTLSDDTVYSVVIAMNALHDAQRSMEQ
jgi:hypothetical protein